jgi:DNA-binding response OmpR family regulator
MAMTLLIVDDSKLARLMVRRALAPLQPGWDCVEAASAEEAEALMAQHPIDIALLDYNMPGRNGLALAAALRARHPGMPIAVVTANQQAEIAARAHAIDAAFLHKPLTGDALRAFVTRAAQRLAPNRQTPATAE